MHDCCASGSCKLPATESGIEKLCPRTGPGKCTEVHYSDTIHTFSKRLQDSRVAQCHNFIPPSKSIITQI